LTSWLGNKVPRLCKPACQLSILSKSSYSLEDDFSKISVYELMSEFLRSFPVESHKVDASRVQEKEDLCGRHLFYFRAQGSQLWWYVQGSAPIGVLYKNAPSESGEWMFQAFRSVQVCSWLHSCLLLPKVAVSARQSPNLFMKSFCRHLRNIM
jgi:hypothetical protein